MSDESKTPEPKPIWMACRATPGCGGRTAILVRNFETEGGRVIRYVCTECRRHWHVPLGGGIPQ